jgi:hypothetical protein
MNIQPGFLGNVPQGLDNHSRSISPWTSGFTGHALPAVPDGITLQDIFQIFRIPFLNPDHQFPWFIICKFGCRTNRSTNPATHAGGQTVGVPDVLLKQLIIIHSGVKFGITHQNYAGLPCRKTVLKPILSLRINT